MFRYDHSSKVPAGYERSIINKVGDICHLKDKLVILGTLFIRNIGSRSRVFGFPNSVDEYMLFAPGGPGARRECSMVMAWACVPIGGTPRSGLGCGKAIVFIEGLIGGTAL